MENEVEEDEHRITVEEVLAMLSMNEHTQLRQRTERWSPFSQPPLQMKDLPCSEQLRPGWCVILRAVVSNNGAVDSRLCIQRT
jgi:hypothetical protein